METTREKEIVRITLWGSVVNVTLTALKFAAGILGCSAAMIADAVHSLSDLLTDFVVLLFVRISSRPADSDHPYGHGRMEYVAGMIVSFFILLSGVDAIRTAIRKILAPEELHFSFLSVIVLLVSMAVKGFIRTFNGKFYEGDDPDALSWSRWFFPVINRTEGLREIDRYFQQYARYIATGRHGKANFRVRYADLKALGYRSLVHEFYRQGTIFAHKTPKIHPL